MRKKSLTRISFLTLSLFRNFSVDLPYKGL